MNPKPPSSCTRCLLTVEAELDPQLPARILGLFTQRGHLPDWFSSRRSRAVLRIVVELADLDDNACEVVTKKILNIPTVLDVTRKQLRMAAEIVP